VDGACLVILSEKQGTEICRIAGPRLLGSGNTQTGGFIILFPSS
jgi:hypothetical protein